MFGIFFMNRILLRHDVGRKEDRQADLSPLPAAGRLMMIKKDAVDVATLMITIMALTNLNVKDSQL